MLKTVLGLVSFLFLTVSTLHAEPQSFELSPSQIEKAKIHAQQSESPSILLALKVKANLDRGNTQDLKFLIAKFRDLFERLGDEEKAAMPGLLTNYIESDRKAVEIFQAELTELEKKRDPQAPRIVNFELEFGVKKLLGNSTEPGLIKECIEDLKKGMDAYAFQDDLSHLREHAITVAKLELVYAWQFLATEKDMDPLTGLEIAKKTHVIYPCVLPREISQREDHRLVLAGRMLNSEKCLWLPNCGYVFGGNFINGQCHGIDCSSLVSHCNQMQARLSTMVMEYTGRELL